MEVGHKINVVLTYFLFFSQQSVPSLTAQMKIFCGSDTPEFNQSILHQKSQINGAISVDMQILSYRDTVCRTIISTDWPTTRRQQ